MKNIYDQFIKSFERYSSEWDKYKNHILYGYHWENGGGTYFYQILNCYYHRKFDYIVDDEIISYIGKIYRKNLFDYLNPEETIVYITTNNDTSFLESIGYSTNKNLRYINKDLNLKRVGFYEYLEDMYNLDIINRDEGADITDICSDALVYSASRGMSIPDVCKYMQSHFDTEAILDVGCGKAGAIVVFRDAGFERVDGIELSNKLCTIARENLNKLAMQDKSSIWEVDATKFSEYNNYNVYYFYDPFRGETFNKVINKIERSIQDHPRTVHLVYANPWEHKMVIKNGFFKLEDQLDGDWFTRMTNIYSYRI